MAAALPGQLAKGQRAVFGAGAYELVAPGLRLIRVRACNALRRFDGWCLVFGCGVGLAFGGRHRWSSRGDQIRRTLARAAPHLLDAVPFIGTFLANIGEKLAEGSLSLRGVYEELSRTSSGPPQETRACFSWSMTCMRRTRTRCIS